MLFSISLTHTWLTTRTPATRTGGILVCSLSLSLFHTSDYRPLRGILAYTEQEMATVIFYFNKPLTQEALLQRYLLNCSLIIPPPDAKKLISVPEMECIPDVVTYHDIHPEVKSPKIVARMISIDRAFRTRVFRSATMLDAIARFATHCGVPFTFGNTHLQSLLEIMGDLLTQIILVRSWCKLPPLQIDRKPSVNISDQIVFADGKLVNRLYWCREAGQAYYSASSIVNDEDDFAHMLGLSSSSSSSSPKAVAPAAPVAPAVVVAAAATAAAAHDAVAVAAPAPADVVAPSTPIQNKKRKAVTPQAPKRSEVKHSKKPRRAVSRTLFPPLATDDETDQEDEPINFAHLLASVVPAAAAAVPAPEPPKPAKRRSNRRASRAMFPPLTAKVYRQEEKEEQDLIKEHKRPSFEVLALVAATNLGAEEKDVLFATQWVDYDLVTETTLEPINSFSPAIRKRIRSVLVPFLRSRAYLSWPGAFDAGLLASQKKDLKAGYEHFVFNVGTGQMTILDKNAFAQA